MVRSLWGTNAVPLGYLLVAILYSSLFKPTVSHIIIMIEVECVISTIMGLTLKFTDRLIYGLVYR